MSDRGSTTEAAQQAWSRYQRLRQVLDARVARDLEQESGLSLPDFDVLGALVDRDDAHCVRVAALAERLDWSRSRLSRQLGRMEQRGLVRREPCELDGRGDDVVLAEKGRAAVVAAVPGHRASVHRHFGAGLSPEQCADLDTVVGILLDHLRGGPSAP